MKSYTININDSNQRIDKYISKVCTMPKSMMYKAIRNKRIKVNGKRCEVSQRLNVGDVVDMYINDEYFTVQQASTKCDILQDRLKDVSTDIDIVYQDQNILIVDKPIGLVVHADNDHTNDTLIDRITKYLILTDEYSPNQERSFSPALCNRLDRNTCGLVVCAKNSQALRDVNLMIKQNLIHKKYLCVTTNRPKRPNGTIVAYHHKDSKTNTVTLSNRPKPDYKQIVTKYRVLKTNKELSLVEVELVTGRTHQIRASMLYIGCPILGDSKYGNRQFNQKYDERFQCLCAYSVTFELLKGSSLEYLNGKTIQTKNIPFVDKYFHNI